MASTTCNTLLLFVITSTILLQCTLNCPSLNVSLQQIIGGNQHFVDIKDELELESLFSYEGLSVLINRTLPHLCLPSIDKDEEEHEKVKSFSNHSSHGDHDHDNIFSEYDNNVDDEKFLIKNNGKSDYTRKDSAKHSQKLDSQTGSSATGISTSAISVQTQSCKIIEELFPGSDFSNSADFISPDKFLLEFCPSIFKELLNYPCPFPSTSSSHLLSKNFECTSAAIMQDDHDHHDHDFIDDDADHMTKDAWIAAIVSLVVIGLIALLCIMLIPGLKKSKYYVIINHFLLSLAVGSLAGDALIHLLSHAMTMKIESSLDPHLIHGLYGFTAFFGIIVFFLMERLHNAIGGRHSHSGHGDHLLVSQEENIDLIQRYGMVATELNDLNSFTLEKNEKFNLRSKHSNLTQQNSGSSQERQNNCFGSCPPLSPRLEDANGNNDHGDVFCKSKSQSNIDNDSNSVVECEKLVHFSASEMNEQTLPKPRIVPSVAQPTPLVHQGQAPMSLVRQDSKNFNMVLQEYHIGHHGHSHHGHSHVTGKKDSLRTMILLGDGMHTFVDGIAIGAAFGSSLTGGIATAIAVMCHELPHKVGDFAILFEMGMKTRQAVKMVFVLWILSLFGLILGVYIGSIKVVSPWIYSFTAGVFLYLALVDLLSELSLTDSNTCNATVQVLFQFLGMLLGAGIMLIIAIYEHDLQNILEKAF